LRGAPGDIPIVHTLYASYRIWNELLIKFPKAQRFTLGENCANRILGSLHETIRAAATTDKTAKLQRLGDISAEVDTAKLLVRLAKDCRCISNAGYLEMQSMLQEVGRMIGGWMKSLG